MSAASGFWFLAGALSAAVAIWVLRPAVLAWRAQSRWILVGGILTLGAAIALYLRLGSPQALVDAEVPPQGHGESAAASTSAGKSGAGAGTMESAVLTLEKRLRTQGGKDEDWELLAKSYEFMKRPDAAASARRHQLPAGDAVAAEPSASEAAGTVASTSPPAPVKLSSDSQRLLARADTARQKRDFKAAEKIYARLAAGNQMTAESWADYADVVASMNGSALSGKPAEYLRRALALDPSQPKALWLQGSLQHESRQYAAAVTTWKTLLALMDPASGDAKLISGNIAEDSQLAGGGAPAAVAAVGTTAIVRGEVTVSSALQARIKPGQVLYIVAKSVNSPGMPVAVHRVQTGNWPVRFELSDADAMLPERRLSTMGPVTVEARISQSGQANAAPGDLLGATSPLDPATAKPLHIVIEKVL